MTTGLSVAKADQPVWDEVVRPYKNWVPLKKSPSEVVVLKPGADRNNPKSGEIMALWGMAAGAWLKQNKK